MTRADSSLLGSRNSFAFEQRIFHFVMLIAVLMTAFGTVLDMLYGAASIPVPDVIFLICWAATYYFSRFRKQFNIVSKAAMLVLIFAFFPYIWTTIGGYTSGPLLCYTVLFTAIICIILNGRFRIAMLVSMLVMVLFLLGYDASGEAEGLINTLGTYSFILFAVQFLLVISATAVLILVYSNTYMKEKQHNEANTKTIEEQYQQQVYALASMEELVTKLKSERHDFNNHLGVMFGLLESNDADKAKSYAAALVKTAEDYQSLVNIPYPTLRAILNYKLSTAREEGIDLRLEVALPPGLGLSEFDLAVIFGNLLDNAVEANRLVDADSRYISLQISYKPDYLLIRAENPYDSFKGDSGKPQRTTKPDADNHGFGLKNIEYLIKKHSGFMSMSRDGGIFTAELALIAEKQTENNPY